jgi:hypothetical protein
MRCGGGSGVPRGIAARDVEVVIVDTGEGD